MVKKLTDGKWRALLGSLTTTLDKGKKMIQEAGLIALDHGQEHKNVARALDLYSVLKNSDIARAEGFKVWVEMFSPIRITITKDGIKAKLQPMDTKNRTEWDIPGAEARPFWTLEEATERVSKPLSLDGFIGVIKSYQGKITKARETGKYEIAGDGAALNNLVENVLADAVRRKAALAEGPALAAAMTSEAPAVEVPMYRPLPITLSSELHQNVLGAN